MQSPLDHEPPAGAAYQVVGPFNPLPTRLVYSEQEQFIMDSYINLARPILTSETARHQDRTTRHAPSTFTCNAEHCPSALKQAGPYLPSSGEKPA